MSERDDRRRELVATARQILTRDVGLIAGCHRVVDLLREIGADTLDDEFATFVSVSSETDTLPIGAVRAHWAPAALVVQDEEIDRAEALYRESVNLACQRVIQRFEISH